MVLMVDLLNSFAKEALSSETNKNILHQIEHMPNRTSTEHDELVWARAVRYVRLYDENIIKMIFIES